MIKCYFVYGVIWVWELSGMGNLYGFGDLCWFEGISQFVISGGSSVICFVIVLGISSVCLVFLFINICMDNFFHRSTNTAV